jgi:hypothetical protein
MSKNGGVNIAYTACDDNENNLLRMQLEDYSDILERVIKNARCFPCQNRQQMVLKNGCEILLRCTA